MKKLILIILLMTPSLFAGVTISGDVIISGDVTIGSISGGGVVVETLTVQVNSSSDDAGGVGGGFGYTATSYFLGNLGGIGQKAAYRFTNVTIPQGAIITSAYLDLYSYYGYTLDPEILVFGDDTSDATTFSTETDFDNRNTTTATVAITSSWGAWVTDMRYEIPTTASHSNLGTIVEEIVGRGDWSSGNALAVLIVNTGTVSSQVQRWSTYDNVTSHAANLHIIYTY